MNIKILPTFVLSVFLITACGTSKPIENTTKALDPKINTNALKPLESMSRAEIDAEMKNWKEQLKIAKQQMEVINQETKEIQESNSKLQEDNNKRNERLKSQLGALATPDKWMGESLTNEELLKLAEAEASASKSCPPGTPELNANDLANVLVDAEIQAEKISKIHADFLSRKTNHKQAVESFNILKPDGERIKLFYNSKISKHCARGARMTSGLNKAEGALLGVINLLNNFVGDLNNSKYK